MNSQTFIKFCKRLIKDADKKIFLILDNLRVHHSQIVKDWVEQNKKIEAIFIKFVRAPVTSNTFI
jgi:hypothetical protein